MPADPQRRSALKKSALAAPAPSPEPRKSCLKKTASTLPPNPRKPTSSDSWEERKVNRSSKIRNRVPTGHPNLAKKLLAMRAKLAMEEDDSE
ncbi:MAG: hypothetical protein KVP17_005222 [Porospora cf. gigantea B]|uniref:uncharacterized protein n=1 Tax=Porospora cf. gigantea B TaxID=2853592 RepID=UPI003571DA2C|nr:MAG: hypothetical protein KVP17_005222 [Porospora cf. gigantea B]